MQNSCEEMAEGLAKFFGEMKGRGFVPKVEQLGQVHIEIDNDENNKKGGKKSKLGKIVRDRSEDESKSDD